jgi:chlorobactene glucosyltransferase
MFLLMAFIFLPLMYLVSVTLFNAFTAPMLKRAPEPKTTPKVSVLIPARNEEITLRTCLEDLCAQDYPDFEILVLDDNSIDDTWSIIQRFDRSNSHVRGFIGSELPKGWLGKPWACQQLAYEASGTIMIFTDADNQFGPDAIRKTVGWMQAKRLNFLSAMPQQFVKSMGERLIIPTVDMLVYSLLPMRLTLSLPQEELSAANGQWLAITRETYKQVGGHSAVKDSVVEDLALARRAKKLGLNTLILAGTGVVFGRMFGSFREVWEGYRKNLFGLSGGSRSYMTAQSTFLIAATVLPYLLLALPATREKAKNAVALNMMIRAILAAKFRHPIELIILHPVAVLLLISIGIAAIKTPQVHWKGRNIQLINSGGTKLR